MAEDEKDAISIHSFADMFGVSGKTAGRWVDEEDVLFEAQERRGNTLFLGTGAIDDFFERYS